MGENLYAFEFAVQKSSRRSAPSCFRDRNVHQPLPVVLIHLLLLDDLRRCAQESDLWAEKAEAPILGGFYWCVYGF